MGWRLRQAIAQANAAAAHADNTLSLADSLLMELKDGVRLTLVREGEGTLLQFLRGEIAELPIKVRIEVEE